MNELMKKSDYDLKEVTEDLLKMYLKTLPATLTDGEKIQFMEVAASTQLNPFKREIYIVAYGQGANRQFSLITGYEVYLKRADRIGRNKGYKVWTTGTLTPTTYQRKVRQGDGSWKEITQKGWEGDLTAHIEIIIAGWDHPFTWEVEFAEYNQKNTTWFEKPKTMIKKVVIGQGFRLAFPGEMGSLPYMAEEMKTTEAEVVETRINSPADNARRQIIDYLESYAGENKEEIKQMCIDKSKAGEFDLKFAQFVAAEIGLKLSVNE